MNLFMLGLDVAMLFTAGAGGSVAKTLTKAGLSRLALETSEVIARSELSVFEKQFLGYAGKAAMWTLPRVAETATAYTIYKAEKSLILGEKFEWSPKEALLMFAMCESFNLARELGVGAKLSVNPKFANGKLSPVVFENKIIGYTNSAGRLVSWGADVTLGASGYYGLLLGIQATGKGLPDGLPSPDKFLLDQFVTLGALHAGAKVVSKISGQVLDNALLKLDQRSNEWLKKAKENMEKGGGEGGGFSWGLVPAYAGAYGSVPIGGAPEPVKGPTVLMMGQWNPAENRKSGNGGQNDFMGSNKAHNDEMEVIVSLVEERLRDEGIEIDVDAQTRRKIGDLMKHYKEGSTQKNASVPREVFPDIAEEIASQIISSRLLSMRVPLPKMIVANDTDFGESSLNVREAAASRIDSILEEALNHKKSPISPKDPTAAKVKEVLRTKFLAQLEGYLSQNPEIQSLADLELYGFFNGKMSLTVEYLGKVAKDPSLLERDTKAIPAGKIKFELTQVRGPKQKDVTDWLGGRELSSLTESQQKELILHLAKSRSWKRGDLQDLIGVEGMRSFFGYGTELPFGFESVDQWKTFQKKLMTELEAGGIPIHDPRVKVVLQGSSVMGESHSTKNGTPYRWKGNPKAEQKDYRRPSDFDIAVIVDQSLFDSFRSKSLESMREREGPGKEARVVMNSRRIQKEKRLASPDLDSDLQTHLVNLREAYGRRPIQVSIMGPGCYLIPSPAEMMVISADMAGGAVP
jgi:hypothetical protein